MATAKQKELCYKETNEHITRVRELLTIVVNHLLKRALEHDQTKLEEPEFSIFAEQGAKLKSLQYGSKEYEESLKELKVALDHHYANNRHHPEHFPNGVNDMNLFDILELLCDWIASSERQHDGNIRKSIETGSRRFHIDSQLTKILDNTIDFLKEIY